MLQAQGHKTMYSLVTEGLASLPGLARWQVSEVAAKSDNFSGWRSVTMTTSRRRTIRPKRSVSHADGTEVRTYVGKAPFDDSPPPIRQACELDEPWDRCQCNGCQMARAWAETGRTSPKAEKLPSTGSMRSVRPDWKYVQRDHGVRLPGADPELPTTISIARDKDDIRTIPAPLYPLGAPTFEELPDVGQQLTWPELPEHLDETADLIETNGPENDNHGRRRTIPADFESDDGPYVEGRALVFGNEAAVLRDHLMVGGWAPALHQPHGFPDRRGRPPLDFSYGEHEQVYELTGIGPEVFDHVVKAQRQRGKKRTPEEQQAYDFVAARIAGVRSTKLLCQAYGTGKTTVKRLRDRARDLGTENA